MKKNDVIIYSLIQDSTNPSFSSDLLFSCEGSKLEWIMLNDVLRSGCPMRQNDGELYEDVNDFIEKNKNIINLNYKYLIKVTKPIFGIGERYKNIYRPVFSYKLQQKHFIIENNPTSSEYDDYKIIESKHEYLDFMRQLDIIIENLIQVFKVLAPTSNNLSSYGHYIRNIILLACMEFDSMMHNILVKNDYCDIDDKTFTGDYVKLLEVMRLNEYSIEIKDCEELPLLSPFDEWNKSHPTSSLTWYDDYNKIKHNRSQCFDKANLKTALNSIAALAVCICAQYGHDNDLWKQTIGKYLKIKKEPQWTLSDFYIPFTAEIAPSYIKLPFM